MPTSVRSFAKINLGLKIGPLRADGFHELRTIYQTIALHDVVRVEVLDGDGIEILCSDPRVPCDTTNTCYKVTERVLRQVQAACRVVITIRKQLPVQGGMGAASSNAVAAMIALEWELKAGFGSAGIRPQDKMRIAADVGSDLPLFFIAGTVLGVDRGQEVYPLEDLPAAPLVIVTPPIGVSTPKAFAEWDKLAAASGEVSSAVVPGDGSPEVDGLQSRVPFSSQPSPLPASPPALTRPGAAGTITTFSQTVFAWLQKSFPWQAGPAAGVPARGGDQAETPLLDLVRTGIENDFERVVFPEYPELREVKRVLEREGAVYASLSGSGSTLYGIFASDAEARRTAERMSAAGHNAVATQTATRQRYWEDLFVAGD